jgi:hypothetical protein
VVLVTALVVLAYLPSWDRWSALAPSMHLSGSVTEGNAFSQPGVVMAAVLLTAAGFAVVTVLGSFWAPTTVGVWATVGAVIGMSSQLISAVFQLSEPIPPQAFGITTAQAKSIGLHTSASLTGWWAADVAATSALVLLTVWAAVSARNKSVDDPIPIELPGPGPGPGATENGSGPAAHDDWPAAHDWPR